MTKLFILGLILFLCLQSTVGTQVSVDSSQNCTLDDCSQCTTYRQTYHVCRKCSAGYFLYNFSDFATILNDLNVNQTQTIDNLTSLIDSTNNGSFQSCVSQGNNIYQVKAVIGMLKVVTFLSLNSTYLNWVAKSFQDFQLFAKDINVVFINQGSVILDFWFQSKVTKSVGIVMDEFISKADETKPSREVILSMSLQIFNQPSAPIIEPAGCTDCQVPQQSSSQNSIPLVPIIIISGVFGLILLFIVGYCIWRHYKQRKNQNQNKNQQIIKGVDSTATTNQTRIRQELENPQSLSTIANCRIDTHFDSHKPFAIQNI